MAVSAPAARRCRSPDCRSLLPDTPHVPWLEGRPDRVCIALFGWGVGFYGVGVLLAALQALHGWPATVVSGAVTVYCLVGAALIVFVGDAMARWGPVVCCWCWPRPWCSGGGVGEG